MRQTSGRARRRFVRTPQPNLGALRPVFQPLERRALLSAAVLDAGLRRFEFADANGDLVQVRLMGRGSAEVTLTGDAADHADLDAIRMTGVDESTSLRITVRVGEGGDGSTTLASLHSDGSLNRLDFRRVTLVGAGIHLAGSIHRLDLTGISGDPNRPAGVRVGGDLGAARVLGDIVAADVTVGGQAGAIIVRGGSFAGSSIDIAQSLDRLVIVDRAGLSGQMLDSSLTIGSTLGLWRAHEISGVDGRIGADLARLVVQGNRGATSGSIDRTRLAIGGELGHVRVATDLQSDSIIAAEAGIGMMNIRGSVRDSMLLAGTRLDADLSLDGATFAAAPIDHITIRGDLLDSILASGGDPGEDRLFRDHEILEGGSINRLTIGGYVAGVHSDHINPGVYAASIDQLRVHGYRLEGKPDDLRAGIIGSAVIDPLPDAATALTEEDVRIILEQMIARATQLGVNATLAVTDREGNILATVRMTDPSLTADPGTSTISGGGSGGLEGVTVASSITAVTKAGTAAFLSTTGNAFTTRTAGQIIQPHFPPGVQFQDSGPLFGVQFSSLPTSDINRLPLGLSADPGGVPIYRGGQLLGGVGVELDGMYTFDPSPIGGRATLEERIAVAGQIGFKVPGAIRADRIFLDGIRLDFANIAPPSLASLGVLPDLDALETGGLLDVLVTPTTSPATMFTPTTLGSVIGETIDSFATGRIEAIALGEGSTVYAVRTAAGSERELISIDVPSGAVTLVANISDGGANELAPGQYVTTMIFDDGGTSGAPADDSVIILNGATGDARRIDLATTAVGAPQALAVAEALMRDAVVYDDGGSRDMVGISKSTGQMYRIDTADFTDAGNYTELTTALDGRIQSFTLSTAGGAMEAYAVRALGSARQLVRVALDDSGVMLVADLAASTGGAIRNGQSISALMYDDLGTPDAGDDLLIAHNATTGRQLSLLAADGSLIGQQRLRDRAAVLEQGRLLSTGGEDYMLGVSSRSEQVFANIFEDVTVLTNLLQLTQPDNSMLTLDGVMVGGEQLTGADVETILQQGIEFSQTLRAAIRRDRPQIAQVTVSVVDVDGNLLGSFRSADAPVFGFDVSVQKARTAAMFSRDDAGALLSAAEGGAFATFVDNAATLGVMLDGSVAMSDRTGGFLSRPFLPDGLPGTMPGPFSAQSPDEFSIFNTGLQVELLTTNLVAFLADFDAYGDEGLALQAFEDGVIGGGGVTDISLPARNGVQIFPGSVPLYKNGVLVGGVGVSGDGIEQDDFVAFMAAAGYQEFGPDVRRADEVLIHTNNGSFRLPYVKFPRQPTGGY
ncbi:MAG: heme-binding protein [Phycisphaerales bacterium]|nr:heme-binding protein [Phycisphaerales bacterium]